MLLGESDRAHRIGQLRRVTIYSLMAKNTIEEKIVDLHKQKRESVSIPVSGSHTFYLNRCSPKPNF